ncbi:MAG: hypothetical protein R3Y11_06210 [Pseudomonadota bacterium]
MGPKKSFNADIANALNPALQFISMPDVQEVAPEVTPNVGHSVGHNVGHNVAYNDMKTTSQTDTNTIPQTDDNQPKIQAAQSQNPEGKSTPKSANKSKSISTHKAVYVETKSKRVQLLIKPSLHAQLKKMASKKKTSFNDLVHTILENSFQNDD